MDLRPTYLWLKKLWTVDHLNLKDWFIQGLTTEENKHLDFWGRPISR